MIYENLGMDEQINAAKFFRFCDYIWTANPNYDYVLSIIQRFPHLKMFSPSHPLKENGIIYCGMCQLVEDCLRAMPETGKYIVIQRDNERPFTRAYNELKKSSVKHVYTIECQVISDNVTAMPFGTGSINDDNDILEQVRNEEIHWGCVPVFCRMNTNPYTFQRTEVIYKIIGNTSVDVVLEQLEPLEFFRQVKAHKLNLSIQSGGKDTTRTWETLFLGRIPIITDCVELRFFQDMPVVYYPENGITSEWLNSIDVGGKSLKRARMSYWRDEILSRKQMFA